MFCLWWGVGVLVAEKHKYVVNFSRFAVTCEKSYNFVKNLFYENQD